MRAVLSERRLLACGLVAWFAVNLVTASRAPTVWHDEVMFADPAVRWVMGKGMTSTAWPQAADTPAVLNGPLHTVVLAGWLKAWQACSMSWSSIVPSVSGTHRDPPGDLGTGRDGPAARPVEPTSGPGQSSPPSPVSPSLSHLSSPSQFPSSTPRTFVNPCAVRSLVYVLTAVAALWLWGLAGSFGVVGNPWLRLMGVAVFLCGNGVSFSYRSGRYDMTGMLVLLGLVTCVIQKTANTRLGGQFIWEKHLRSVALVALGALVPFAGLHLVPYSFLLAAGACLWGPRRLHRPLVWACVGIITGCGLVVGMHWGLGTWSTFLGFVRDYGGGGLRQRFGAVPSVFLADPSLVPLISLLIPALVLTCILRRGPGVSAGPDGHNAAEVPGLKAGLARVCCVGWHTSPVLAGVLVGVGIPVYMTLVAKFPVYYSWMAFLPTLACVLCWVDRMPGSFHRSVLTEGGAEDSVSNHQAGGHGSSSRWYGPRFLVLLVLVAYALLGWPGRIGVCVLEWSQRDYARVDAFVRQHVIPTDIAYADWQAYYPLLTSAEEAWFIYGAQANPTKVHDRVSVLVICPEDLDVVGGRVGGRWIQVAEYDSNDYGWRVRPGLSRRYWLGVFRRQKGS